MACLECYVNAENIEPVEIIVAVRQSIKNLAENITLESWEID